MSEKLKNELQKRLDAARLDPASLRDAKNSRELLALVADERGQIRDDAAAALEQMRGEGVAIAAYEQGIRLAAGGSYTYDNKIGREEIEALALMGKVRFEEEATVSDPSVGSISTRPYLRSESDIASTSESLAGFIGGLDRAKWSKEAVAFMDRTTALLAGRPDKKAVQAMQREVSSDFPAEYSKRKDDGDLGAATRLAIFRRLMRFSLQSSPAAAPAETVRRPEAPIFSGLTGASWEEHASDTVYTASYRAMMLYVESCRTDRAKLETALAAIDAEIGSGRIKNEYLAQAMRGTRAEIVKILDGIKSGRIAASDKPLEAIPAGSILSGLHGIVWEPNTDDTAIVGAERAMHAWIDAHKDELNKTNQNKLKLREAYDLLEREIRSGRAKNDLMRGAMGSAKARIAEMIADPSKADDKPFVIPEPLKVPPVPKIAARRIPGPKPAPAAAPLADIAGPTDADLLRFSKGAGAAPASAAPAVGLGRTKGMSAPAAPVDAGAPKAPADTPAPTRNLDTRVAAVLADMPARGTLDPLVAEPLLRQLEGYLDEFESEQTNYQDAKKYLDGLVASYTVRYMRQHIVNILTQEIPKHSNTDSRKALQEARDELLDKLLKKPKKSK
jgi:hypothetical protein